VVIPTDYFVTAYRILTDYKAVAFFSFSSLITIATGFIKLPRLLKPSHDASYTPYVKERRLRLFIPIVGVATIAVNLATIWFHYRIPAEIGHVTNPPLDTESFRPQLERFLILFALLLPGRWPIFSCFAAVSTKCARSEPETTHVLRIQVPK